MSEERKLILQMVAEGKITPEDADKLLQALDESERTAHSTATEQAHRVTRAEDLGAMIDRAVGDSLKSLEGTLRGLEINLERKLNDPARQQLITSIEEKMRRSVERAVGRAQQAEERTRRIAERAEERAKEQIRLAEEKARRFEERARAHADRWGAGFVHFGKGAGKSINIVKYGICIDKASVERTKAFTLPAEPGDTFHLENRVGDVRVEYYDGSQVEVAVQGTFWGEDEADANQRADAFHWELVRQGPDVLMAVSRPTITVIGGFVSMKDTRLDYAVRLPQGMHLSVKNKAGDLVVVGARQIGQLHLLTKVGNVDVKVAPEAGFTYDLSTNVGTVRMGAANDQPGETDEAKKGGYRTGRVGDGAGRLEVSIKTGDIRVIN